MMELNSSAYWVVSAALFVGLLAGMYLYVRIVWLRWEPRLKSRVERGMGVKLNYSLSRFWNIDHASWTAYSGNRAVLWLKVTVMSFTVVFGLVLVLLVPLVVLGLVLALLLRGA